MKKFLKSDPKPIRFNESKYHFSRKKKIRSQELVLSSSLDTILTSTGCSELTSKFHDHLIDSSFIWRKFHTLFCYPLCCLSLVAPSSLGGFPVLKWLYLFPSFPTWQEKSRIPRQILSFCNLECKNVLLLHDILDSNGTSNNTGSANWNFVKHQLFLLTLEWRK